MSRNFLQAEPPRPHDIRSIQPEFYLQVLQRVCAANYAALALVMVVSGLFFITPGLWWSAQGPLGTMFGFVVVEFLVFNTILAGLLRYRGWYLRTPRLGLNRLTHLTGVVLIWDAIHVLGVFFVFGGFHGPAVVLLPLLCLVAYIMLPARKAAIACILLAVGLLLVGGAQMSGLIYPLGALGVNFTRVPESTPAAILIVLAGLGTATLIGSPLHRWLGLPEGAEYNLALMDRRFGCFTLETLSQRVADESQREEEFDSAASFVVIGIDGLDAYVAANGIDEGWQRLIDISALIVQQTRADLDTAAYLGGGRFGVLLPTATSEKAAEVAQRVLADALSAYATLRLGVGIAQVPRNSSDGDRLLETCIAEAAQNYRVE